MARQDDIAELLERAGEDGAVRWSDVHVWYEDGERRGHVAVEPHIQVTSERAVELWRFAGARHEDTDTDRRRHFRVDIDGEIVEFDTNAKGDVIWVDHDLSGWVVWSKRYGEVDAIKLVPRGEMPTPDEYTRLLEAHGEESAFYMWDMWSTELISKVLAAWSLAFCGLDLRFEFHPDLEAVPAWLAEVTERAAELEAGRTKLVPLCGVEVLPEDALPGERGVGHFLAEAKWRNPDGQLACDEHKHEDAEPLAS